MAQKESISISEVATLAAGDNVKILVNDVEQFNETVESWGINNQFTYRYQVNRE